NLYKSQENSFHETHYSLIKNICQILTDICKKNSEDIENIINNNNLIELFLTSEKYFGVPLSYEIYRLFYFSFKEGNFSVKNKIIEMGIHLKFMHFLYEIHDSVYTKYYELIIMLLKGIEYFLKWGEENKNNSGVNIIKIEAENNNIDVIIDN